MSRFWVVALIVSLVITGCSESPSTFTTEERDGVTHALNQQGWNVWSDSAAAPLQLTREQTYGTNEGSGPAFLGGIRGVAVDSTGTVYVLDDENHRLVAFNPDGSVRWSGGRQGQGPGEFQDPSGLIVGPDRLYVENQFGRQIDIWTTEGDFVDRHTFPEEISLVDLVGFAEDHLIVSETGFGKEPQQIHALDPGSWDRVHSFPVDLDLDLPEGLASSASVTTVGDSIYVSRVTEYTLRRYGTDGTLGRQIERGVDVLVGPGVYTSGDSRGIRVYSSLSAPTRLSTGHFLVSASWPTNVDDPNAHYRRSQNDTADEVIYAASLDLFEASGRYVGSLRWDDRRSPPFGRIASLGPNGTLYTTTNDPFPQVRRYEVTLRTD
jgi:outer membrane protein assembly factor BamB